MVIKIKSENSNLLDILHKNPNTDFGLYLKSLKNGVLVGNAVSNNEYHCVFQDTKYSYLPEAGNQIDFQSYCNPLLILNILTEFFNHLYKENDVLSETIISWLGKTYQEIDTESAEIEISTIFLDSGWFKNGDFLISKYVSGIEMTHKIGNNYQLKISGENVRDAIQKLSMVALFIHFTNRYAIYTFIDDYFVQKYITIITNIKGIPYFVFYLFIKRIMRSPKQFEEFKPQLEAYFDNKVQFVFTDTHQSRKEFVCGKINFDEAVLDFGCGELQYFKKLHKQGFKANYYAYDEVSFEMEAQKIIENQNLKNLFWIDKKEDLINFEGQIILSEVIEHNQINEAKDLLIWIRDHTKFSRLFITTPNKDFNINYEMVDEFRHDDHDFELTKQEFIDFINEIFPQNKAFFGIGDCVNGSNPTSAVIVNKL
jgi:hypothetical protein